MLYVRVEDSRGEMVFGDVRSVAVTVLLRTSSMTRFVMGSFRPEQKIVPFHSSSAAIFVIKNIRDELRDEEEAQDVLIMKKGPKPGARGEAKKDPAKFRRDYFSRGRRWRAGTDSTTTTVGQFSSLDYSLEYSGHIIEKTIYCQKSLTELIPHSPCSALTNCSSAYIPSSIIHN